MIIFDNLLRDGYRQVKRPTISLDEHTLELVSHYKKPARRFK